MNKILFVGGGSGGHIIPSLAISEHFKKEEIRFICSRGKLDKKILSIRGIKYTRIFSGKLRRYFDWRNFTDVFLIILGFFQSFFILIFSRPKVIFSKGGFVSLPVGISAFILRIPFVLHESDAQMGLANRILSKTSNGVLSTFPLKNTECVGTPIRAEILKGNRQKGDEFLKFDDPKKPVLLIIGGSQGALKINAFIKRNLNKIHANIVLIAGNGKASFPLRNNLRVYEFLNEEIAHVMSRADLVISRASAGSIAELSALSKPCILIPLSSSANNHQMKNALKFQEKEAGILLDENQTSDDEFVNTVNNLLTDSEKRQKLGYNIYQFYVANSAEKIVKILRGYL